MPAVMPPSQKTNKLATGRGRESKSAVMPTRTGSIATTSDRKKTALHIFVTVGWSRTNLRLAALMEV